MRFLTAVILAMTTMFAGFASASETVEGAKKDYAAVKAEVSAQLDALDKKIEQLKASTTEKSTAAKEKTLKEAEEARIKSRTEYDSMKESTITKWTVFKKRLGRTLDHVNERVQKALKE